MRRSGVGLGEGEGGGGRAERNGGLAGRAPAAGMHRGSSSPRRARHGQGCAVGRGSNRSSAWTSAAAPAALVSVEVELAEEEGVKRDGRRRG